MSIDSINIRLLSETTPGEGRGSSGEVDLEIDYDQYGLPRVSGRSIQGILRDSWESLVSVFPELFEAGNVILGKPGSNDEESTMRIGDAEVPLGVKSTVIRALERRNNPLESGRILLSLTSVRYQTAQSRSTGTPQPGSLRSSRVLIPGITLVSPVTWHREPLAEEKRCLALCVLASRHLGAGTSRGRGYVRMSINGDLDLTHRLAGLEVKLT